MKTLLRLFCSIDVSLGISIYIIISALFGEKPNLIILCITLFAAHFPDLDILPWLILRKRLDPFMKRLTNGMSWGHWPYGHHPIFVTLVSTASSWIGSSIYLPGQELYLTTLFMLCVASHFIHDASQLQGLHLFSPLSWKYYSFAGGIPHRVPDELVKAVARSWIEKDTQNDKSESLISSRVSSLTKNTIALCIASNITLFLFWFVMN